MWKDQCKVITGIFRELVQVFKYNLCGKKIGLKSLHVFSEDKLSVSTGAESLGYY